MQKELWMKNWREGVPWEITIIRDVTPLHEYIRHKTREKQEEICR